MDNVGGVHVVDGTEGVVQHSYDVVFFQDRALGNRLQDFLEVRLDTLHDDENFREGVKVDIIEFFRAVVKLFLKHLVDRVLQFVVCLIKLAEHSEVVSAVPRFLVIRTTGA